jgi:hypothetical protein
MKARRAAAAAVKEMAGGSETNLRGQNDR